MSQPPTPRWPGTITALGILLCFAASIARADSLESTSGAVIEGKIISRDDKMIVIEVQVGGKPVQRRYANHFVRAITIDGNREVLSGAGKSTTPLVTPGTKPATNPAGPAGQKSRQEIEALIQQAKTPPDWLESTPLNYPRTLDLSWPEKPPGGGWNAQKNVGQFLWDVIHPNPGRWREGVKFMYFMMEQHKGDAAMQAKIANTLGGMYAHLFQDHARAAWWWRQAAGARHNELGLAECYWKLGSKAMAAETLGRMDSVWIGAIKLWADMGEIDKSLRLVDLFANSNGADEAIVMAGDACRNAGRTAQAINYYEKVLAIPDTKHNKRSKDRARASLEAVKLFDTLDLKKVPDGAYLSSSLGYEAQVEIEVKVAGNRIESVKVLKHREKQFYSSITDTCGQIIQKQSVKGIDATTRATITSEAIINATAKALHGAMK